ncbi:protein kinase family protein [Lactococcus lactis subsp. lactis]|nr:protein kinase family protein [Lactococcus lactis subsp. lactis]
MSIKTKFYITGEIMVVKNGENVRFLRQKDYVMVDNRLGNGSFGKTVVIRDSFIDELFVAKKYEPMFKNQDLKEKFFENFLDEIKILFKLNHKNIVRIYNYYPFEDAQTAYIIMEHIKGKSIEDYILENVLPLGSDDLDNLFIQLVEGFSYIEKNNIIHRDIREGNILVDESGTVKIIDFGIGKFSLDIGEEQSDDSLRTQVNRKGLDLLPEEYYKKKYTSKTDMFYLGELFNRLMRKTKDFSDNMFSYHSILNKMMKYKPEERYESFEQIINEFSKTKFKELDVTEQDKRIYQTFSESLVLNLYSFKGEPVFVNDPNIFMTNLEKFLESNLFEYYVQDYHTLISTVVLSNFSFGTNSRDSIEDIREFLTWFKESSQETQNLILKNIISKLSTRPIEFDEAELPF